MIKAAVMLVAVVAWIVVDIFRSHRPNR